RTRRCGSWPGRPGWRRRRRWPSTRPCTGRCRTPWPPWTRVEPVARRMRLDAELVRRGLARSREQAAELIAAGRVEVRGTAAAKAAAMVDPADPVRVRDDGSPTYVSRGGHKLAGALAEFGPARSDQSGSVASGAARDPGRSLL